MMAMNERVASLVELLLFVVCPSSMLSLSSWEFDAFSSHKAFQPQKPSQEESLTSIHKRKNTTTLIAH